MDYTPDAYETKRIVAWLPLAGPGDKSTSTAAIHPHSRLPLELKHVLDHFTASTNKLPVLLPALVPLVTKLSPASRWIGLLPAVHCSGRGEEKRDVSLYTLHHYLTFRTHAPRKILRGCRFAARLLHFVACKDSKTTKVRSATESLLKTVAVFAKPLAERWAQHGARLMQWFKTIRTTLLTVLAEGFTPLHLCEHVLVPNETGTDVELDAVASSLVRTPSVWHSSAYIGPCLHRVHQPPHDCPGPLLFQAGVLWLRMVLGLVPWEETGGKVRSWGTLKRQFINEARSPNSLPFWEQIMAIVGVPQDMGAQFLLDMIGQRPVRTVH